jgi:hypothetical protein
MLYVCLHIDDLQWSPPSSLNVVSEIATIYIGHSWSYGCRRLDAEGLATCFANVTHVILTFNHDISYWRGYCDALLESFHYMQKLKNLVLRMPHLHHGFLLPLAGYVSHMSKLQELSITHPDQIHPKNILEFITTVRPKTLSLEKLFVHSTSKAYSGVRKLKLGRIANQDIKQLVATSGSFDQLTSLQTRQFKATCCTRFVAKFPFLDVQEIDAKGNIVTMNTQRKTLQKVAKKQRRFREALTNTMLRHIPVESICNIVILPYL